MSAVGTGDAAACTLRAVRGVGACALRGMLAVGAGAPERRSARALDVLGVLAGACVPVALDG